MRIATFILSLAMVSLMVLAAASLIRGFLKAIRYGGQRLPYEPVVDLFPPLPIERTRWAAVVSVAAIVWGVAHVSLGLLWVMTGMVVDRQGSAIVTAIYFCFGASLTGIGGGMMLARMAYGRRMVSWGQFLLAIGAFMALAISVMIPSAREMPQEWREAAVWMAGGSGLYLLAGTVLGAAAQRVGKPKGGAAPPTPLEEQIIPDGRSYEGRSY
jgi:hypothetical protein